MASKTKSAAAPPTDVTVPRSVLRQFVALAEGLEHADSAYKNCQDTIFRDYARSAYRAPNVRAAAGFRVKLHAKSWNVCICDSFYGAVVYIEKTHFCIRRKRSVFNGITGVLACDVNAALLCIFARMISAAVSIF